MRPILLITLAIILALPITAAQDLFLDVSIPATSDTNNIDLHGNTLEGARVEAFVNGVRRRIITSSTGEFEIFNLPLAGRSTNITVTSTLGEDNVSVSRTVISDHQPPKLEVNIPALVTDQTYQVTGEVNEPVTLSYRVINPATPNPEFQTLDADGSFTFTITLQSGQNKVEMLAVDQANHTTAYEANTSVDIAPPTFESTNLAEISPSYTENVRISGKTSEPAAITVFLNGQPETTTTTNNEGYFSIKINLARTIRTVTQETGGEIGQGWENEIYLVATDKAGRTTTTLKQKVVYALCGFGNWFNVRIDAPIPSTLTPRLMMQNIQQIGFPFNLTYRGNYDVVVRPGQIRVDPIQLSAAAAKDYDNAWAQAASPIIIPTSSKSFTGYQQILLNRIPTPSLDKNSTRRAFEIELAKNRMHHCLVPETGCVKLLLQMEIPFQEKIPRTITPGAITTIQEPFVLENKVQKTCIPVEVMIDPPVPDELIPTGFLENTVNALDNVISLMDDVLHPLTQVYTYTFYSCGVAQVWYTLFKSFDEEWNCKYGPAISKLSGGGFDTQVAEAGLCEQVYEGDDDKQQACMACQTKKKERMQFYDKYYKPVCDRIFCPSAPTAQNYIRKAQYDLKPIKVPKETLKDSMEDFKVGDSLPWMKGDQYWTGNDCAAWAEQNKLLRRGQKVSLTYKDLKKVYADYNNLEEEDKKKCLEPHPANPACCAVKYVSDWGTACGIPLGGLDTFDELKESTCIAAKRVGKNEIELGGEDSVTCNNVWNSVAGFCEPKTGEPRAEPVRVGNLKGTQYKAYKNDLYIFVIPRTQGTTTSLETRQPYDVILGYAQDQLVFDNNANTALFGNSQEKHRLSTGLYAVTILNHDKFGRTYFSEEKVKTFLDKNTVPAGFRGDLEKYANVKEDPKKIYENVIAIIGGTEQEYVVRPESTFFRSLQCACLPASVSYITLWKNVFTAVRNCFDSVATTGDGTAGPCQEAMSTQICDLVYDGVKCFSQKLNFAGKGRRTSENIGVGDVFGALTGAGQRVSQEVRGRYGDSSTYQAIFADRKLVHAMCGFAFTGNWNLNVNAFLEQGLAQTPIDSTGLVFPCERRFLGYNPLTTPKGLATWNYHIGTALFAGANVNYRLELKCSKGFGCEERNGFKNGECDCNKRDEMTYQVTQLPGTRLNKNDVLSEGVDVILKGGDPASIVRYDKAVLTWEWDAGAEGIKTGSTECKISQVGPDAPAFCAYDVFSLSYRCQFGDLQSGIKIEKAEPHYQHQDKKGQPAYGLGEALNFTLDIRQVMPTNTQDQLTAKKYLTYMIKNQNGDTVDSVTTQNAPYRDPFGSAQYILATDGDYQRNFRITTAFNPSHFTGTGSGGYDTLMWVKGAPKGQAMFQYQNAVVAFSATKDGVPLNMTSAYYLIQIDKQRRVRVWKSSAASASPDSGFNKAEQFEPKDGALLSSCVQGCTFTLTKTERVRGTDRQATYRVSLNLADVPSPSDTLELRMRYPRPRTAARNPCVGTDKGTAVPWTITFGAYDSDSIGAPSTQLAIDPATGQPAQKTVQFNIACESAADMNQYNATPEKPPTGMHTAELTMTPIRIGPSLVLTEVEMGNLDKSKISFEAGQKVSEVYGALPPFFVRKQSYDMDALNLDMDKMRMLVRVTTPAKKGETATFDVIIDDDRIPLSFKVPGESDRTITFFDSNYDLSKTSHEFRLHISKGKPEDYTIIWGGEWQNGQETEEPGSTLRTFTESPQNKLKYVRTASEYKPTNTGALSINQWVRGESYIPFQIFSGYDELEEYCKGLRIAGKQSCNTYFNKFGCEKDICGLNCKWDSTTTMCMSLLDEIRVTNERAYTGTDGKPHVSVDVVVPEQNPNLGVEVHPVYDPSTQSWIGPEDVAAYIGTNLDVKLHSMHINDYPILESVGVIPGKPGTAGMVEYPAWFVNTQLQGTYRIDMTFSEAIKGVPYNQLVRLSIMKPSDELPMGFVPYRNSTDTINTKDFTVQVTIP